MRRTYNSSISNMLSVDNTSNPNRFWSFIKGKRTEFTGVAPLRREGILHSDTATKANILSDQFTSVFSSEQGGDIPTKENSPYSSVLDITCSPSWCLQTTV